MPFALNSNNCNISPYNALWIDIITGYDHTGRPIYAAAKDLQWDFDAMATASYHQFSALAGTSLTSIQTLNLDNASYSTYTTAGIVLQIPTRPKFEAGYVQKFSVKITGITP